jgi:hypothetical protein
VALCGTHEGPDRMVCAAMASPITAAMMPSIFTLEIKAPAIVEVASHPCPVEMVSPNLAAAGISESTYVLGYLKAKPHVGLHHVV